MKCELQLQWEWLLRERKKKHEKDLSLLLRSTLQQSQSFGAGSSFLGLNPVLGPLLIVWSGKSYPTILAMLLSKYENSTSHVVTSWAELAFVPGLLTLWPSSPYSNFLQKWNYRGRRWWGLGCARNKLRYCFQVIPISVFEKLLKNHECNKILRWDDFSFKFKFPWHAFNAGFMGICVVNSYGDLKHNYRQHCLC